MGTRAQRAAEARSCGIPTILTKIAIADTLGPKVPRGVSHAYDISAPDVFAHGWKRHGRFAGRSAVDRPSAGAGDGDVSISGAAVASRLRADSAGAGQGLLQGRRARGEVRGGARRR